VFIWGQGFRAQRNLEPTLLFFDTNGIHDLKTGLRHGLYIQEYNRHLYAWGDSTFGQTSFAPELDGKRIKDLFNKDSRRLQRANAPLHRQVPGQPGGYPFEEGSRPIFEQEEVETDQELQMRESTSLDLNPIEHPVKRSKTEYQHQGSYQGNTPTKVKRSFTAPAHQDAEENEDAKKY